jgi:class 3 adenylate cyclase
VLGLLLTRKHTRCSHLLLLLQVFTASIGSQRREFGMFGDVVNTAARLMSAGKKDAAVAATAAAAAPARRLSHQGTKVCSLLTVVQAVAMPEL